MFTNHSTIVKEIIKALNDGFVEELELKEFLEKSNNNKLFQNSIDKKTKDIEEKAKLIEELKLQLSSQKS